jgi:uncharacterized membrane protein
VSIQADQIAARVWEELDSGIERLFPEHLGTGVRKDFELAPALRSALETDAKIISAPGDGYLEFVAAEELLTIARDADLLLQIERRPGHYVIAGMTLLRVSPQARVYDELEGRMRDAFILGSVRTSAQDIEFCLNQLVEIAVRALSPGVNDPFTAVTCIDRLGSALARLAQREMPASVRRDDRGAVRIIAPASAFPELLAAAFNQIRQYGAASVAVTVRLLEVIRRIGEFARRGEDISALQHQADMIVRTARGLSLAEDDRCDIEERHAAVVRALGGRLSGQARRDRPT